MNIQPRTNGKYRNHTTSYLESRIREALERDAIRWKCSVSWVQATALAAFYDIDIITPDKVKAKRAKKPKKTVAYWAMQKQLKRNR